MARLLSLCFTFCLLSTTDVEAHELTAFQELLITYVTLPNILLVFCSISGVWALLYLTEKIIRKLEYLKIFWEGLLYTAGLTCIVCGYLVSGTHKWIFGFVGALLMTGALELSDRYQRVFMSRLRYYVFASVIWGMATFMYQFESFGILTASSLFMVSTIYISERYTHKYCVKNREELDEYANKKIQLERYVWYLFRDSFSALGILLLFMLLQVCSVIYQGVQVFLPGFAIIGGFTLVFDLVYVSLRENLCKFGKFGKGLDKGRYWRTQLVATFIALVVWLTGYLTDTRELSLVAYIFAVLYVPAKIYDIKDSPIWRRAVTLVGCVALGVCVYLHKETLSIVTLSDIYSYFNL
jgi:hypothetical protein